MKKFAKILNKYAVILIANAIFQRLFIFIPSLICKEEYQVNPDFINIYNIPTIVDFIIKIVLIILLVNDLKKYDLKNYIIVGLGTLFFPLLGVVIFLLLLLYKDKKEHEEKFDKIE